MGARHTLEQLRADMTVSAPAPTFNNIQKKRIAEPYVSCCVKATNNPSYNRINVYTLITDGRFRCFPEFLDIDNERMVVQLPYKSPREVDLSLTRLSQMEISNDLKAGYLTDAFKEWLFEDGDVSVLLERLLGLVFLVDYWKKANKRTGQTYVCTYQLEAMKKPIADTMIITGDKWTRGNCATFNNRRYVAEAEDQRRIVFVDTRQREGHHDEKHQAIDDRNYFLKSKELSVGDYQCNKAPGVAIDTKSGVEELCQNLCFPDVERFENEVIRAKEQGIQLIVLTVLPNCYTNEQIKSAITSYVEYKCAHCGYCRTDAEDNGCKKHPGEPKGATGAVALNAMSSLLQDYPETLQFRFASSEYDAGVIIVSIFRGVEEGENYGC